MDNRQALDKLKKLIKTGDSAKITQALELAEALFKKNSKEMKEILHTLNSLLDEKAWEAIDYLYDAERTYLSAWNSKVDISVPLFIDVGLTYGAGVGLVLKVDMKPNWFEEDIVIWSVENTPKVAIHDVEFLRIIGRALSGLGTAVSSRKITFKDFSVLDVEGTIIDEADTICYELLKIFNKKLLEAANKIAKKL